MSRKKPDADLVFQALGDATRRRMLEKISRGPISVSQLAEPFDMTLAAVVQHLQVLEESGLISTQKIGRVRTCNIERAGFQAAEAWIANRRSIWDKRLDALGDLLSQP
ncbi:MAG TPA: metalloregulator ArsR/SmtB family transcription factor [Bryobacteraceae bacterium]|nr:metalloregulator ArsR/SmtB family transcription factor [Bryobacteraceae bacterium]